MNEQFVTLPGGIELCYETFGDPARPTALLIMGLGTQMVGWHPDFCAELAGRGWEVESSLVLYRQQVENPVQDRFPQTLPDGGVGSDYAPIIDDNGVITKSADEVRQEDMDTLFHGIPASSGRVTRLRSDVAHTALNVDLTLGAGAEGDLALGGRAARQDGDNGRAHATPPNRTS